MCHSFATLINKKKSPAAPLLCAAALSLLAFIMLFAGGVFAADTDGGSQTTGTVIGDLVDRSQDLSVTYVIGTVHLTGSGGVQAG